MCYGLRLGGGGHRPPHTGRGGHHGRKRDRRDVGSSVGDLLSVQSPPSTPIAVSLEIELIEFGA